MMTTKKLAGETIEAYFARVLWENQMIRHARRSVR